MSPSLLEKIPNGESFFTLVLVVRISNNCLAMCKIPSSVSSEIALHNGGFALLGCSSHHDSSVSANCILEPSLFSLAHSAYWLYAFVR